MKELDEKYQFSTITVLTCPSKYGYTKEIQLGETTEGSMPYTMTKTVFEKMSGCNYPDTSIRIAFPLYYKYKNITVTVKEARSASGNYQYWDYEIKPSSVPECTLLCD